MSAWLFTSCDAILPIGAAGPAPPTPRRPRGPRPKGRVFFAIDCLPLRGAQWLVTEESLADTVHYHLGGFPPEEIDWARLAPYIGRASAELARFDATLAQAHAQSVLLAPLTTQEAVLSSAIEGTAVTLSEVLEMEAGGTDFDQEKRDDAKEVSNYQTALRRAASMLSDTHFSPALLRATHALLMSGVRGRSKSPGAYRSEQNYIVIEGHTAKEAVFVPIPQVHLQDGIDKWFLFASEDNRMDTLTQLAILHAEFEALHPFMDGNGRMGRILIPLFLYWRHLLHRPYFYMSGYLEANREEYISALRNVSRCGAWTEWIVFFLNGIAEQALENQKRASDILDLHHQMTIEAPSFVPPKFAMRVIEYIFEHPIFSGTQIMDAAEMSRDSARRVLDGLRKNDVIRTIREGAGRRPAIYIFHGLINLAEGREIF